MTQRLSEADSASSGKTCSVECGPDLRASKSTERAHANRVAELNDRFSIFASEVRRIGVNANVYWVSAMFRFCVIYISEG